MHMHFNVMFMCALPVLFIKNNFQGAHGGKVSVQEQSYSGSKFCFCVGLHLLLNLCHSHKTLPKSVIKYDSSIQYKDAKLSYFTGTS